VSANRIVVVDDHAGFRRTARRVLEADGWEVIGEAVDGASAVAVVAALRPDVVLVDVHLPDADGFDVAERLSAGRRPAIVLISSHDAATFADRIAASPARGFVAKSDLAGDALRVALAADVG
jgi:DNA-binding NarL/FixJ family response regulator